MTCQLAEILMDLERLRAPVEEMYTNFARSGGLRRLAIGQAVI